MYGKWERSHRQKTNGSLSRYTGAMPATKFLPVCCPSVAGYKGIHDCRDTGNMLLVTSNMLLVRATCPGVRKHGFIVTTYHWHCRLCLQFVEAVCGLCDTPQESQCQPQRKLWGASMRSRLRKRKAEVPDTSFGAICNKKMVKTVLFTSFQHAWVTRRDISSACSMPSWKERMMLMNLSGQPTLDRYAQRPLLSDCQQNQKPMNTRNK